MQLSSAHGLCPTDLNVSKTPLSLHVASFHSQHFLYDKNMSMTASWGTQDPTKIHSFLELSPKLSLGLPKLPQWTTVPAWNAALPFSACDYCWVASADRLHVLICEVVEYVLPGKHPVAPALLTAQHGNVPATSPEPCVLAASFTSMAKARGNTCNAKQTNTMMPAGRVELGVACLQRHPLLFLMFLFSSLTQPLGPRAVSQTGL